MNPTIDTGTVVIDGHKLKQARESRQLSVAELAALLTMSREQVQHIEEGGDRPFYTPAHKLLAIRKYAGAMGIPYDEVVSGPGATDTMPVPEAAPASLMVHGEGEEATDLRLAAVERNAEIRRFILIGIVLLMIVLAFYAKLRDTSKEPPVPVPATGYANEPVNEATNQAVNGSPAQAASMPSADPTTAAASASATTSAATSAAVPAAASVAATVAAPAVTAAPAPPAVAVAAVAAEPAAAPPPVKAAAPASPECSADGVGEAKTWTPVYPRKADTRLFVVSPKTSTICIVDAAGKATQLTLKARAGQAFSGKPPYVVQSPLLSELEIFLQGARVRVPPQTRAIRLKPATGDLALQ